MPQLDTFRARVKTILLVGSELDAEIDEAIKDAASEFELRLTLKYMERYRGKDIYQKRYIDLPEAHKDIHYIRYWTGCEYVEVVPRRPEEHVRIGEGNPTKWWTEGDRRIWFDRAPVDKPLELEFFYHCFSAWPLPEDSPLYARFRWTFLCKAVELSAIAARKPQLGAEYGTRFDTQMEALAIYDYANEAGMYEYAMQYVPYEGGEL